MPTWSYSVKLQDEERVVKASLREVFISPKHAVELARELKNKTIEEARKYLEEVISMKRAVPFKRYNRKVAHRKGLHKWHTGRYPVKAAKHFLKLLENLENNAEYKGLDPSRIRIIHIATHRGRRRVKYIPRAFGRSSPLVDTSVHVEVIGKEL